MKVADDQLFKQENCTKREEFNALRIVIPSLRIDTEKESKPAEMFSIHGESRKEGILILPGHCEKTLLTNSSLSLLGIVAGLRVSSPDCIQAWGRRHLMNLISFRNSLKLLNDRFPAGWSVPSSFRTVVLNLPNSATL